MDVAAGLCEGDGPLPEKKRPIILEVQDVLITYRGKATGKNYWFSEDATDGIAVRKR